MTSGLRDGAPGAPQAPAREEGLSVVSVPAGERTPVDVPACPVCDATEARPLYRLGELPYALVVCVACGTGRLHPMPDEEAVRSFYSAGYYGEGGRKFAGGEEWLVRLGARLQARRIARRLRPGDRVLDVGCGRGVLLGVLADRGIEAHGVEVSEAAAEGLDPRVRLRLAWQLAEAGYEGASFRRIVLWHVLEHLQDPAGTLEEARRLLAADGLLDIAVPHFGSRQARWAGPAWFHLDPPRHLWHFPLPALRVLLERHGFRVEAVRHFSLRQDPFGWVQSALNRLPGARRDALYRRLLRGGKAGGGARAGLERVAYWAGMPPALALSLLTAAARSGATIHLAARLQAEARP